MIAFQRRRGRAQQRHSVFHFCPYDGDISAVVSRRLFLLITVLLLLINDDQPEPLKRRKHRSERPDHEADVAVSYSPPFPRTLHIAKRGVQHRHSFESRPKPRPALTPHPQ